jgi:actin-related protein
MAEYVTFVLDIGSYDIKAGVGGNDAPYEVRRTAISTTSNGDQVGLHKDFPIRYPVKDGVIQSWDDIEAVWDHCVKVINTFKAGWQPSTNQDYETYILVAEHHLTPHTNRAKQSEILFEKIGADGLHFAFQAPLSLFASGRVTGIVVDSGYTQTSICPIFDSSVIRHCCYDIPVGGYHVTERLRQLLGSTGAFVDFESANHYKETQFSSYGDRGEPLTLPDGKIIPVPDYAEDFCTDVLFNPKCVLLLCLNSLIL